MRGSVDFLYGKDFKFRTMIDGSHFGEYEVIKRKPREFTVVTSKRGEFLVMSNLTNTMEPLVFMMELEKH